jgi:hypothetical protein
MSSFLTRQLLLLLFFHPFHRNARSTYLPIYVIKYSNNVCICFRNALSIKLTYNFAYRPTSPLHSNVELWCLAFNTRGNAKQMKKKKPSGHIIIYRYVQGYFRELVSRSVFISFSALNMWHNLQFFSYRYDIINRLCKHSFRRRVLPKYNKLKKFH